jgi:ATP/maltotriose-dependent transcriptional regulator MalT
VCDAFPVAVPQGESTFVGRAPELSAIDALLSAVCGGRAAALVVAGDAGMGKSRLVGELRRRATSAGALVAIGRTPVEGAGLPYGTVVGLVRDLRRQLGPDDIARLEPVQRILLGGAVDGAEAGQFARLVLFEEMLEAVDGLSAARPLVLVLEDVHWADAGSVELLDHLVRNLDAQPVFVVATHRPDELDARPALRRIVVELRRLTSTTSIELSGLSRDEIAALAAGATGEPQPWARVDAIHRRSEGNPLFAEELMNVRDASVLPPALRDLLAARIDQLERDSRRVAVAASVIGAPDHRLLSAVAEMEGPDLDAAIVDAVRHGVLVVDGAQGVVRFRHALLREVAHDALLPGERARLHARAADALVAGGAVGVDGAGHVAAQLAEHRFEAGDWAGACEASIAAARACLALYSLHAAHAQLLRAIEAHGRAGGTCRHVDVDEAELYRMAAEVAYLATDKARAFVLAERAVAVLDPDAMPDRVAACSTLLARAAWAVGRPDAAFAVVATAEDVLRPQSDVVALAVVICMHGLLLAWAGRATEGVERCDEALELARRADARLVEGHALATAGVCLAERGELDTALVVAEEGVVVAEALGDLGLLMRASTNLTYVRLISGRLREAAAVALDALTDTGPLATVRLSAAGFNATEALIALGRWDEADTLAVMLSGTASATSVSDTVNLALLALRRGDIDAAAAELAYRAGTGIQSVPQRETLAGEIAFDHGRPEKAVAQRETLTAEIALERGRPEEALAAIDRSLAALGFGIECLRAHAVGLRALADQAAQSERSSRRVGADPAKALRLAEAMLTEVESHVAASTPIGGEPSPWLLALGALCRAESTRLRQSDSTAWSAAAAAWRTLGDPFHAAYCRFREAEALLAGRADRRPATAALKDAWQSARRLGAAALSVRCERLAERAHITLDDPTGPSASPHQRAGANLGLTTREVEVLELLAGERTDRQIADELFISKKTASVHVSNILRKLDARDRWRAGEVGRSEGLGERAPNATG